MNGIINGVVSAINSVANSANSLDVLGVVPDLPTVGAPTISLPRLKTGMDFVPRDWFPAFLDRGERVLTAEENQRYSNGSRDSAPVINVYVSGSVVAERDIMRIVRDAMNNGGYREFLPA
jgi:hypothetical protein